MCQPADSATVGPCNPDSLFARARSGDQKAWAELVEACYPKVLRAVRRKLNSQQAMRSLYDSTDFVSDVWKSLAENPERFNFPTFEQLQAFLFKIAERKVIDEYRRLHAQKNDITRDRRIDARHDHSSPPDLPSADPTPSEFAQAHEAHDRLLSGQTGAQRLAIELKGQGYSTEEIAERTGWSPRKVQRFFKDLGNSWEANGPGGRP